MKIVPRLRSLDFVWLCLFLSLTLSSCVKSPPVLKIGLVAPFEGRFRPVGYDVIYSARLAIREINAAGGINDYHLALVALDDGGDIELAQETASALIIDPDVVAVIGHWLPETTTAVSPIYEAAHLTFFPAGVPPFGAGDPAELSAEFQAAYAAVTPFEEEAGPYAGSAYTAFQHLFAVLAAAGQHGPVSRTTVYTAMTTEHIVAPAPP